MGGFGGLVVPLGCQLIRALCSVGSISAGMQTTSRGRTVRRFWVSTWIRAVDTTATSVCIDRVSSTSILIQGLLHKMTD